MKVFDWLFIGKYLAFIVFVTLGSHAIALAFSTLIKITTPSWIGNIDAFSGTICGYYLSSLLRKKEKADDWEDHCFDEEEITTHILRSANDHTILS